MTSTVFSPKVVLYVYTWFCDMFPLTVFLGDVAKLLTYLLICFSVTLSGPPFKGFLLEARDAENSSGPPVGSFTLIDSHVSQLLTCEDVQVCVSFETDFYQFPWVFSLEWCLQDKRWHYLCIANIWIESQWAKFPPNFSTGNIFLYINILEKVRLIVLRVYSFWYFIKILFLTVLNFEGCWYWR